MSISKNYIKMCEKAEEIQKMCQFKMGDWFTGKYGLAALDEDFKDDYIGDNWVTREGMIEDSKKDECIWLPTLEQLFEMLLVPKNTLYPDKFHLINMLSVFMAVNKYNNIKEYVLAFVYRELYHKIWTSEKWVKEN